MMILTTKFHWRELSAILTLSLAFLLCYFGGQQGEYAAVSAFSPGTQEVSCEDYLRSLGWTLGEAVTCDRIQMPDTFGSEYDDFLSIQTRSGFDLTPYAGKVVDRRTYPVTNYPDGRDDVYADLLLYNGTIIGGEIRSAALDGFMEPLNSRKADAAAQ